MRGSYRADFLIVGSGFAGAAFARLAADSGLSSDIIEKRNHIGGNCFTYRDEISGVEVHKYGPHIFHTSDDGVWEFVNRFTAFNGFINRVKGACGGGIYSLPINLHTINQFFGKTFRPQEAETFIDSIRHRYLSPANFEEYILYSLGEELYRAFFRDYTIKQWGVHPREIDIGTAKRLPVRFTYNDDYYDGRYQGIPSEGYSKMFDRMIENKKIHLALETSFDEFRETWRSKYRCLVYTGSIDQYFKYAFGYLPYRTITFNELRSKEIQGNAVINYTDMAVPFTRVHEHKWFTPEKRFQESIGFEEYSAATDSRNNPFYPIRNRNSEQILKRYEELAALENDVIFVGRLAEYRYYDMDQVIGASMSKFKKFKKLI